jgi:hypothetical protein
MREVTSLIEYTFPLSQAAHVLETLESGMAVGKVIIQMLLWNKVTAGTTGSRYFVEPCRRS